MMCRRATRNADQAGVQTAEQRKQLAPPDLPAKHCATLPIDPVDLKDVLGDVEADCGNLHVGGSLLLMADDSTIMARLDAVGGAVHLFKIV